MWAAATGTFSAGGSPTSKVRGRSWEEGPHAREEAAKRSYPTSEVGAAVESARLRRYRNGQEELPHARGQGPRPGGPTPRLRPGVAAGRTNPTPEARGSGREDLPHA